MQLEPCAQCRRHVASDAPSCPFCAAPRASTSRSVLAVGGRLSRAAVFSLAACSGGAQQTQVVQPPPPPPADAAIPVETTQFATPPPDGAEPATAELGVIEGAVIFGRSPGVGVRITLHGPGLDRNTQTGPDGSFTFTDVPVGQYKVTLLPQHPSGSQQVRDVTVVAGTPVRVQYTLASPVQDRGPCCKPYGAPPARRRIV